MPTRVSVPSGWNETGPATVSPIRSCRWPRRPWVKKASTPAKVATEVFSTRKPSVS
jgi:hypothetical protein